jgi:DNA polymerase III subunit gamma/tau
MSYQVLARKWRPRRFQDVVGQEHVMRALSNALEHDRLHHAYLFTGTRGTGKTTLARILAKCLNCEQGVTANPCGQCSACVGIDEGRFVDLIEVDAASRAKVDETRDLMDNVQYAPSVGRYKVYLIDEVHMFSGHSFNALLKTLEEPPPHVKFLLATTEPKKIPITILSRCIQFNLKHLTPAQIEVQLQHILEAEAVACERPACRLLANAAEGSLRDALSLLDQAIAYGDGRVEEIAVREMLGTLDSGAILELLELLAADDGNGLLQRLDAFAGQQHDYAAALAELLGCLHRLAILQTLESEPIDEADPETERLQQLAQTLSPEDVQLYYQIALHGRRDLPLSPDPRAGFEMVLIRMLAFRPGTVETAAPGGGRPATQRPVVRPLSATAGGRASAAPAAQPAPPAPAANSRPAPATGGSSALMQPADWRRVLEEMTIPGLAGQLASHCVLSEHTPEKIQLVLAPEHEPLLVASPQERLQQVLRARFGEQLRLNITVGEQDGESPAQQRLREASERQREAIESVENDPMVKSMLETFDAVIDHDSIRPE